MSNVNRRQFVAALGALPVTATTGVQSVGRAEARANGGTNPRGDQRTTREENRSSPNPAAGAALFNEDFWHVTTVLVGEQHHDIYRYENYLSEDAGLEVFRGDERLVSENEVAPVFEAEGWHRALRDFQPDRVDEAAEIGRAASRFNDRLTDVSSALGTVLDVILEVQKELGRELWDNLTDLYPEVTQFRETVDGTKTTVDAWVEASNTLVTSTQQLAETASRVQDIQSRDDKGLTPSLYTEFDDQLTTVRSSLRTLESDTEEFVSAFDYLAAQSREIGDEFANAIESVSLAVLESITDDGDGVAEPFEVLADVIESVPTPARDFAERARTVREHFAGVQGTASRHASGRLEDWRTRRKADEKLRYIFGGGAFAGLLLLSEFWSVSVEETEADDETATDDGTNEDSIRGVQ